MLAYPQTCRVDFADPVLLDADDVALCRHIASNLGNGAVVETSDNRVLVLQRGTDVGECPGQPVFPGGHPEVLCLRVSFFLFDVET